MKPESGARPEELRDRGLPGGPGLPGMSGRFGSRGGMSMRYPGMAGPVARPVNAKKTLRRIWSCYAGERASLSIIFGLVLAENFILLSVPWLLGRAIDAIAGPASGRFGTIIATLAAAYCAASVLNFTQNRLMARSAQKIVQTLRAQLFAKLQTLGVAFFDSRSHGDMMSRFTNDIDAVSSTISQSSVQLMSNLVTVSGTLVLMFILSPALTAVSLVSIPLVFFLTSTITKNTRPLFKAQQSQLGALNSLVEESISGLREIKSFCREDKIVSAFSGINEKLCATGIKAQIWTGFLMPMMNVINNLGFVAIASVGGILALRNLVTIGVIASFISYSRQFVRPLNDMAATWNSLMSAIAGAERVFEVLDEAGEEPDSPGAIALDLGERASDGQASAGRPSSGVVEFRNVGFGYRPDTMVLRNVSFTAEAGSVTALVGPTGAGKTTIVSLLVRFHEIGEGSILLDGRDIRDYTRESLRRAFGIVLQDTWLFSGTIRENIAFARPDASMDEIVAAAKIAGAHTFIEKIPGGYDATLSESGDNLSQGQRQLLSIARAVLADHPIFILDEATSNVDTHTEMSIQRGLAALRQGRTSFVIAHRLSTVRKADRILVIDKGGIREEGSHESLMAQGGFYRRLYEVQRSGTLTEED